MVPGEVHNENGFYESVYPESKLDERLDENRGFTSYRHIERCQRKKRMTTTITKTVTVIKRVVNVFTTTFSSLKSHPMLKTGGHLHFLWNRRLKMEFSLTETR